MKGDLNGPGLIKPLLRVIGPSITKRHHFENYKFYKMVDELNGQTLPVYHTKPDQNRFLNLWHFAILWSLKISTLTTFASLYPVVF